MADLTDITAYLLDRALAAVYPGGTAQPSVSGTDVKLFEGWPIPDQLDRDIAAGKSQVSVFPMRGTGVEVPQHLDNTYTIVPVSYGLALSVVGAVISATGQPHAGEYVTLLVDNAFVFSRSGAGTADIFAALAADAIAAGYAASSDATSLTIAYGHALVVRQGGVATLGKVTHNQKHPVMVTVWAPNRVVRAKLASAIDNLIKQVNRIVLPDTSQAIVTYNRTDTLDELQSAVIYRRDLIFDAQYATVFEFPGYVVTSVNTTIASLNGPAQAQALA